MVVSSYFAELLGEHCMSLLLGAAVLLVYVVYKWTSASGRYKWPPGPPGWPLFGNLFLIRPGGTTNEEFIDICNKYDKDMVTLKLFGTKKIVVLNSYKAIKKSYIDQATKFSGRPKVWPFTYVNKRNQGIFFEDYTDAWKREKKYMVKTVRHFGYGTPASEQNILTEANRLADWIGKQNGKSFDISEPLSLTMLNVTFTMVFSVTYEIEDESVKEVLKIIMEWFFTVFDMFEIEPLLPILDKFPNWRMRDAREKTKKFCDFVQQHIDHHRQTLDPENPRDMTDQSLIDMASNDPKSSLRDFDNEQLLWLILLFIPDQGDTAPAVLRFFFLAIIHHPEVQTKIQEEISNVVGDSREPLLTDKDHMPYTEAAIFEALRMGAAFFLITPHTNHEDVELMGYKFPPETEFIPNFWAVHMDPDVWGDPENFRPERFIDDTGCCVRRDEFIPFSAGRRTCLGEQLAQKEFFIFVARLLQRYTFTPPEGKPLPVLKPQWLYLYPPDFKLVAKPRFVA